MDFLEKLGPWIADSPIWLKVLVSLAIVLVSVIALGIVWSTPNATTKDSLAATKDIVAGCYWRAVFTRTHAQLSLDAMFASIGKCQEIVQEKGARVALPELSLCPGTRTRARQLRRLRLSIDAICEVSTKRLMETRLGKGAQPSVRARFTGPKSGPKPPFRHAPVRALEKTILRIR
jgi:hypothetical protein